MTSVRNRNDIDVHLRAMTEDDVEIVGILERKIFPDPWPESAFSEALEDELWGQLVAEVDGTVIGYACYMFSDNQARLTNIAVDPLWRRKSVAKRLLERILTIVYERKCELVLLEVRPSNHEARKLYTDFGFKDLYRKPNYYRRPVEDALVMVHFLQ